MEIGDSGLEPGDRTPAPGAESINSFLNRRLEAAAAALPATEQVGTAAADNDPGGLADLRAQIKKEFVTSPAALARSEAKLKTAASTFTTPFPKP